MKHLNHNEPTRYEDGLPRSVVRRLALLAISGTSGLCGLAMVTVGLWWIWGCLSVANEVGGASLAIMSFVIFPSMWFWSGYLVYVAGNWALVGLFGASVALGGAAAGFSALKGRWE